ncbi:hypothetical protein AXX12_15930 [Anaerosporomusa subterranea]|uniref:EamA domain-containing protein n=1 Tax=Anaerosporomusa subterranea TaxID=1794912 RepID=A0A154BMB4_ANASB|nr:DMT family transporter [Anaerosporomusa subterranea]KYZ75062.1 hypothetical protein AXX12_15930 [Anaerosporomusa subterranea]
MENQKRKQAEIVLLIIIVIWGINTPVIKIGLMAVEPLAFNAMRLLIAAALSCVALLLSKTYRPITRKAWRQIAAISVLGYFMNQILIVFGIPQTTAGNAALMLATLPVDIALINRILKIEPISRKTAIGICIGLSGVFLVVLGSDKELSLSGQHLAGALLILSGQFCYGYYTVLFKQMNDEYSIYQIGACVMTANALLFCLLALPNLSQVQFTSIPTSAWFSIIFSGIFALSLANIVWIWTVGILGSTKAALYQNLCPIVSIAFAWVYLDEGFGTLQWIGAAVAFLGLYLTRNLPSRRCLKLRTDEI